MVTQRASTRRGASGFTYLGVLAAVAILSIGLLAAAEVWTMSLRRERLAQLDWIGKQFEQAIASYHSATPGADKAFPPSLQDLVQDPRYAAPRRHLREMYPNPFTGLADWEPVMSSRRGIVGVRATIPSEAGPVVKEFIYQPDADTPAGTTPPRR